MMSSTPHCFGANEKKRLSRSCLCIRYIYETNDRPSTEQCSWTGFGRWLLLARTTQATPCDWSGRHAPNQRSWNNRYWLRK